MIPNPSTFQDLLHAYDGHVAQPQGVLMNFCVELAEKTVLIDIEVINIQLDYNFLLGHSYMYVMRIISSTIFRLLMFPHDGKVVTINQMVYYDPKGSTTPEHVLPTIDTTIDSEVVPSLLVVGLGLFTDTHLNDTFLSLSPPPSMIEISDLYTITSSKLSNSS